MSNAVHLKSDTKLRKRWFTPEATALHPAKGNIGLWQVLIDRYTEPGQWVLDPMAGIGTTLVAALMDRNVICLEKEAHFIRPMLASWRKMQQSPLLGYETGQVLIIRGLAQHLPLVNADAIITSPPYEEGIGHGTRGGEQITREKGISMTGRFAYTRPDAIITSPPYENQVTGDKPDGKLFETERRVNSPASGNRKSKRKGLGFGYTAPDVIVTSPPFEDQLPAQDPDWLDKYRRSDGSKGGFGKSLLGKGYTRPDAIIVSPPYEGIVGDNKEGPSQTSVPGGWKAGTVNKHGGYTRPDAHDTENIGQMRGERYWAAMKDCYTEWRRCLKPGGLMVLVIKGCTRNSQYVDLPGQTRALCEEIGWTFVETWKRELWSLSFWRILESTDKVETITGHRQDMWGGDLEDVKAMKRVNNGKMDERLRFEEVLVMRNGT